MIKRKIKKAFALLCAFTVLTTSVSVWSNVKSVKAEDTATTVTPVTLDGFRFITTSNFKDRSGNVMADTADYTASSNVYSMVDDSGNPVESFNKTLLSLKVKFTKAIASAHAYTRLEFGGYTDSTGLRIWTSEDGSQLYFNNTSTSAKVAENIYKPFSAETAGVDSFLNDEFILQISFEIGDYDEGGTENDIRLRFYFDGELYEEAYHMLLNYNADKVGNCLRVFGYQISDKPTTVSKVENPSAPTLPDDSDDEEEITPVTLDGFRFITTSNFKDRSGNVMADTADYTASSNVYSMVDDSGNPVESFNKTLLSLKVKFTKAIASAHSYTRLEFAGYTDSTGLRIWTSEDGSQLYFNNTSTSAKVAENIYKPFSAETAGVDSFLNDEFILQISFEIGDYDEGGTENDIRLRFYFDGELYEEAYHTLLNYNADNVGNCLRVFGYQISDKPTTVSKVENPSSPTLPDDSDDEEEIKPVTLEGFTTVTTRNFVDANGEKLKDMRHTNTSSRYHLIDDAGNPVSSFNKTLLSFKTVFEAGITQARLEFAGTKDNSGFRLVVNSDGTQLWFNNTYDQDKVAPNAFQRILASDANIDSFLNQEFLIQISFEYGDFDNDTLDDDVRLGFYINGKLYNGVHNIISDCDMTKLGNCLRVYCNQAEGAKPITLIAYDGELGDVPPGPGEEDDTNEFTQPDETFRKYTFSALGVEDGTYVYDGSKRLTARGKLRGGYNKTVFYGNVRVAEGGYARLTFGGKDSAWNGLNLVIQPTRWVVNWSGPQSGNFGFINSSTAGTELSSEWLHLMVSMEILDADKDGVEDDIRVGLWFNNKLNNGSYIYILNRAALLGDNFSIYCEKEGATVEIRSDESAIEPFDFAAFGLTENWKNELLNTGMKIDIPVGGSKTVAPESGDKTKFVIYALLTGVALAGLCLYGMTKRKEEEK